MAVEAPNLPLVDRGFHTQQRPLAIGLLLAAQVGHCSARPKAREARKLADVGIKLLVLGGAFAVVPMFLGKSAVSQALASLRPIGLLMLVAGVGLLLLGKKFGKPATSGEPANAKNPATSAARREVAPAAKPQQAAASADASSTAPVASVITSPERPQQWGKAVFDVIEWRRFEAVVERLFQQAGFETKSQSHGADEGVDVWLYSRNQPGEPVSLVQCKHWQGKRVGVDKIRELRGVMAARNVKRGQFATTSTFTPDAITFARENGVNLLDVDGLPWVFDLVSMLLLARASLVDRLTPMPGEQLGELYQPVVLAGRAVWDHKVGMTTPMLLAPTLPEFEHGQWTMLLGWLREAYYDELAQLGLRFEDLYPITQPVKIIGAQRITDNVVWAGGQGPQAGTILGHSGLDMDRQASTL